MNINEKVSDGIDSLGVNLKRAPSAGTVSSDNDNNMWERSQSDANLSFIRGKNTLEKKNVSEDARVYLDLSLTEQDDVGNISVLNTFGFQRILDTIPQHDELIESNSNVVSPSSNLSYNSITDSQNVTGLPMNQIQNLNQSYVYNSGMSSLDHLSNLSANSNMQTVTEAVKRKSCSALPADYRRPEKEELPVVVAENVGGRDHRNIHGLKSFHSSVAFPSNYFCESDFDDSREKIPNYQTKLKSLQDEMTTLILSLWDNQSREFQWPGDRSLDGKREILSKCKEMLAEAWLMPNVGRDCATSLCDLIRQEGLLRYLTVCMSHAGDVVSSDEEKDNHYKVTKTKDGLENRRRFVLVAAQLFSQILTSDNLDNILGISSGTSTPKESDPHESLLCDLSNKSVKLFKEVVRQSWHVRHDKDLNREFISILEAMLKHHENTNRYVVQSWGLKSLIYSCRSTDHVTLRRVAIALVNFGLFGDSEVQMIMAHYKVADWLFPLAFNNDDIIKYYACLAIVVLAAHKELTQIIQSSGTIDLVFSFIRSHSPYHFAESEPSHFQGRSKRWLRRLLPLLKSDSVEAVTLASFHFVMEARIKLGQGKTEIFKDIGAIKVLQQSASSIHKIAAQFSRQALKILGMSPPFSLSHPVPIWSVEDVSNWLQNIGFECLRSKFRSLNVDGDILLTIDGSIMETDIAIKNGISRLRLLREINKLKMTTTYETCDPTGVYEWLKSQVGPEYCKYTYPLIKAGVDRKFLIDITDDMLRKDCFITNSVHRTRILNAVEACKIKFQKATSISKPVRPISLDRSYALSSDNYILSNHTDDQSVVPIDEKVLKNIDIFISYRRSNGSQLASLIMVHLKLRGYRVFLDIERLPAGKFNENLLQSIQRSKNFLIVLTANALDRCLSDSAKKDWIHREVVCAMESRCNIIPVTDNFVFPDKTTLPEDMRAIVNYNAVSWVHDYQEACIDKIEQSVKNSDYQCPFSPPSTRMLLSATTSLKQGSTQSPDLMEDFLDC